MVLKISGEGEACSLNDAEASGFLYGGKNNIRFLHYSVHKSVYQMY